MLLASRPRDLEDAEVDLDGSLERGHGDRRSRRLVTSEELCVVQVGQDVAVHDEEVLGDMVEASHDRAHGAQWLGFFPVVDGQPPLRPVPAVRGG